MRAVNITVVVIVLLGAVILSASGRRSMESMHSGYIAMASPFLSVGAAVKSFFSEKKNTDVSEQDVAALMQENSQLRTRIRLLEDLQEENRKLRDALGYRERSEFHLLPARVVSREASTWWNTLMINRGFEDGVETDMPVLTEQGLVGKVTVVSKNFSKVLLITDENCKVAARVEGTNEKGILSGVRVQETGAGELQLNFLTKNANLQPGQKVYTVGVSDGVFPAGIPLGTVKSFRTRELDGQALVIPAVDVSTVEDVFIIVGAK